MAAQLQVQRTTQIGGKSFGLQQTLNNDLQIVVEKSIAAAKAGTLTVRTNNTDGTLTMAAGHGFTTGVKIDLYWSGGSRRNVTVGTVATNSVPISGGSGDNLPIATTAITAMQPTVFPAVATGDNITGLVLYCEAKSTVIYADASHAELYARVQALAIPWDWFSGNGDTNPLAGDSLAELRVTHGDSSAAKTFRSGILHS